ncbi:MAG: hypothetical protein HGA99_00840 [Chlorobiaceae bacterium]|nr:hypothetical protein [Chlorobiaceae bacterium]
MNLRDELLLSHKSGNFLQKVGACSQTDSEAFSILVSELVALNNEGLIDIVGEFELLKNEPSSVRNFFHTRRVFEKALPEVETPLPSVMRCVLKLYTEAGHDILAHTIFDGFIEFCKKNESRPREALAEIEKNPDDLADLLTATLFAGFCCEPSSFLNEAIRLCKSDNIELRKRAVFALGKFALPDDNALSEIVLVALECSVIEETADHILASILTSAFSILLQQKAGEQRVLKIIETALSKGDESTLHAASQAFWINNDKLTNEILDLLLVYLMRIKPSNKNSMDNLDLGILNMLKSGNMEKGVRLVEDLLLSHSEELTMEVFDSAAREILSNKVLLNKILTRWFLRGDRVLCNSVCKIVELHHGDDLPLEVNPEELNLEDLRQIYFVARKAVGYLFTNPITVASILISLMRTTTDKEMVTELGRLLYDPLLINYTGALRAYLIKQSEQESGEVQAVINDALAAIESYLNDLRSVGDLAALHPGEMQREANNRHNALAMTELWKAVVAKSVCLNLFPTSVLLYGRKMIDYVHGINGEIQRMETPLNHFTTEIENPRMEYLDPYGLDYMLLIFRAERLNV